MIGGLLFIAFFVYVALVVMGDDLADILFPRKCGRCQTAKALPRSRQKTPRCMSCIEYEVENE